MARLKPNEKRAQLSFQRADDLRLFEFLSKRAYEARYDVGTFIIVSLQEAFKGQIEEDEVNALAEEAAAKVRYRTSTSTEPPYIPVDPPPVKPQPVSMERAMKDAEAQIAALDNVAASAMKKRAARKGVPQPPEMPKEK
jgi:hypothetical protein